MNELLNVSFFYHRLVISLANLTGKKAMSKYHFLKHSLGVRRAAECPGTDNFGHDPTRDLPGQKTVKQPRKHSAKYLLRQGDEYVENWNSPGCELSELYGGMKSPKLAFTPSPPLSSLRNTGNQVVSFPNTSPTFPCGEMPCGSSASSGPTATSGTLRSPFLTSTPGSERQSPILAANLADLAQSIMMDFKPVAYSTHALSAITDTFWDSPAVSTTTMPSKPSRVLGLFQSSSSFPQSTDGRSSTLDALASSPSIPFLLSPNCSEEPGAAHQYTFHGNSEQLRFTRDGDSFGTRSGLGMDSNGFSGAEDVS